MDEQNRPQTNKLDVRISEPRIKLAQFINLLGISLFDTQVVNCLHYSQAVAHAQLRINRLYASKCRKNTIFIHESTKQKDQEASNNSKVFQVWMHPDKKLHKSRLEKVRQVIYVIKS